MACIDCNKNVIPEVIPTIIDDDCKGCYTDTQCIIITEDNDMFKKGDNLTEIIKGLVDEINLLKSRIEILENN